jgi:hypothetical protein
MRMAQMWNVDEEILPRQVNFGPILSIKSIIFKMIDLDFLFIIIQKCFVLLNIE